MNTIATNLQNCESHHHLSHNHQFIGLFKTHYAAHTNTNTNVPLTPDSVADLAKKCLRLDLPLPVPGDWFPNAVSSSCWAAAEIKHKYNMSVGEITSIVRHRLISDVSHVHHTINKELTDTQTTYRLLPLQRQHQRPPHPHSELD